MEPLSSAKFLLLMTATRRVKTRFREGAITKCPHRLVCFDLLNFYKILTVNSFARDKEKYVFVVVVIMKCLMQTAVSLDLLKFRKILTFDISDSPKENVFSRQ